jgi:hypothetical protein
MATLAHKITFGKEKYHLHIKMQHWCEERIGKGGWHYNDDIADNMVWCMDGAFGNTFFYFRNPEDAVAFKLVWS